MMISARRLIAATTMVVSLAAIGYLVWGPTSAPTAPVGDQSASHSSATGPGPVAAPTGGSALSADNAVPTTPAPTASASAARPQVLGVTLDQVPAKYRKQVESIMEAQRTRSHPERLSPRVTATPFDPVAYQKDPSTYLDVIEPGRVYDTAKPTGQDDVHLVSACPDLIRIPYGGTTPLAVKTRPGAAVTYTTMAGGHFDNFQASITVPADDKGIAAVNFTAKDTVEDINILVGSPVAVGTVCLMVISEVPRSPTDEASVR